MYSGKTINHNIYILPNYSPVTENVKPGDIVLLLHKSIKFPIRNFLSVNSGVIEFLCIETINKKSKNILSSTKCCLAVENTDKFKSYLSSFLAKSKTTDKT